MLDQAAADADAILVSRLIAGDRGLTEGFVRENAGWMLAVARRYLRDEALAEDCVQESFCSAFASLGRFQGRSRLRSWLHRIVVNAALMRLRTIRRRQEHPLDDILPALEGETGLIALEWCETDTPLRALERSETCAVVSAAIARLPAAYREVLMMRDIDDMDTAEVAAALGLSEANVKVRLHRARRALKALLEPLLMSQEIRPQPCARGRVYGRSALSAV